MDNDLEETPLKLAEMRWGETVVRVHDGPLTGTIEEWELSIFDKPYITWTSEGLDFVSFDFDYDVGTRESIEIGISLDDLIEEFMDQEYDEEEKDAQARRAIAIDALERAANKLRTAPLRLESAPWDK